MKRASFLVLMGVAMAAAWSLVGEQGTSLLARQARTVQIEGNDQMRFSVTTIDAKPGEQIRVVLRSVGKMPKIAMAHNFVLLTAGSDPTKFANESAKAGPAANYIAAGLKNQVLANTALAGNGETVEVTFKAPDKPGSYTFLCSFPGHFAAGMRGTLVVK